MYYVYSGSYTVEENALNSAFKLFKNGYDVICTKLNRYYRLQVGAFQLYDNAYNFAEKLKSEGFPAFIDATSERIPETWQLTYLTQN